MLSRFADDFGLAGSANWRTLEMLQAMQPKLPPLPAALRVMPRLPDVGLTMKVALAVGARSLPINLPRAFPPIPSIIQKMTELTCRTIRI